jgi:hypothetical protein
MVILWENLFIKSYIWLYKKYVKKSKEHREYLLFFLIFSDISEDNIGHGLCIYTQNILMSSVCKFFENSLFHIINEFVVYGVYTDRF